MANHTTTHPVFCDLHHQQMELVVYLWELSEEGRWEKAFFRCRHAGCARHFTPSQGYIDIRNQQIEERTERMRLCRDRPEHYRSVAIVGFERDKPIWRCIYRDCVTKMPARFVA